MEWIKEALDMLIRLVREQAEETVGKKLTDEQIECLAELFILYHHTLRLLTDKLREG
ncbi:MAG: hypothetical protein RMJ15_04850 [Nitrososphaerota archaeon]|nr:hypothetical protein [Nitrososphaerota archaeon]